MSPQHGLSLVELLIAMAIGLLLIAGTGQVFLSGRTTARLQQVMGAVQENGRVALYYLQRDLRVAGFPRQPAFAPYGEALSGSAFDPAQTRDGGRDSDQVAVRSRAETDCLGSAVPRAGASAGIVTNRYFVQSAGGVRRLMCGSNVSEPQPLVEGIERLEILYGLDTDADGTANRYLPWDSGWAAPDWARIVGVRIGVLAGSVTAGDAAERVTESFLVLDGPPVTFVRDARRWRVFRSTLALRNRAP